MLAKTKLNGIEVLISRALMDSNISHDEFGLISNMVKGYDVIKEFIKDFKVFINNAILLLYV